MEIALAAAPHSPRLSWCWQQPHPEPPPRSFGGTGNSRDHGQGDGREAFPALTFHIVRGVTQLQLPDISCPQSAVLKGIIIFPFPISSQKLFL